MDREEAKTRLIAMKAKFEMLLSMRGLEVSDVFDVAIEALSTSEIPNKCEDAISRQAVLDTMSELNAISFYEAQEDSNECYHEIRKAMEQLPPVTPKQKMGHCKECKYFEYDSWAMVDGIPLIVAHEICSKWGGGCKTNEDGYCFLYEPQESED